MTKRPNVEVQYKITSQDIPWIFQLQVCVGITIFFFVPKKVECLPLSLELQLAPEWIWAIAAPGQGSLPYITKPNTYCILTLWIYINKGFWYINSHVHSPANVLIGQISIAHSRFMSLMLPTSLPKFMSAGFVTLQIQILHNNWPGSCFNDWYNIFNASYLYK